MLYCVAYKFLGDDRGGGTVMGLLWFVLLVGICGLAVDGTDGFRNRTMLQATADAAALAAVIDLPDESAAKATAVTYAAANMGSEINGSVLVPKDVVLGAWDSDTRTFTPAGAVAPGTPLDAVYVMTKRSAENSNPLPVNFLRIIGLDAWNVRAQAIAQRFLPDCLRNGLISRLMVDMSSNNAFVRRICIHGQKGVNIQSNNYFEKGVTVSMYDMDTLEIPSSGMTSNTGLPDALTEKSLDPRDVNHVDGIMSALIDKDDPNFAAYVPDYIDLVDDDGNDLPVIEVNDKFDLSTVEEGRIYYVNCKSNKNAAIPGGSVIKNVVIIADCQLSVGSNAFVMNAVLGSRSGPHGNSGKFDKGDANIDVASSVQLGLPDNCASGGGVKLFSNATMHFSSTTGIDGVQMVAAGDIALGARDMGINGISAQAGGNIYLTSNNMFGLCTGGVDPLLVTWYYRLVL